MKFVSLAYDIVGDGLNRSRIRPGNFRPWCADFLPINKWLPGWHLKFSRPSRDNKMLHSPPKLILGSIKLGDMIRWGWYHWWGWTGFGISVEQPWDFSPVYDSIMITVVHSGLTQFSRTNELLSPDASMLTLIATPGELRFFSSQRMAEISL